jgi:GT2 family glycosyltransferase
MPRVRVYLCTYRRNHLLRRAVESLLNQTFRDWVCELHNDDPADKFPEELVRRVGDPRITLVNHEVNYGPTRSFNGFFKPISETYFSILEDDNWWEPEFLQRMVAALEAHRTIQLAWANMRRWIEQPDGSWTDTGIDVWDRPPGAVPELFYWPQPQQLMGALHSNGAMLARSAGFHITPCRRTRLSPPSRTFASGLFPIPCCWFLNVSQILP